MNNQKYISLIILVLLPFLLIGQSVDEYCTDFTRVSLRNINESGVYPYLLPIENPYSNNSNGEVYAELALIYYKTDNSDVERDENNGWDIVLNADILEDTDQDDVILNQFGPIELKVSHKFNESQHISVFRLPEALAAPKLYCRINSVTTGNNPIPTDVYLELRLIYKNHADLNIAFESFPDITYSKEIIKGSEINSPPTGRSKINLSWTDVNADYYELFYVYVDDLEDVQSLSLVELFRERALNVETKLLHHSLDVSYPKGKLYVAVRPTGKVGSGSDINAGFWNEYFTLPIPKYRMIEIETNEGFERAHNWSFEKSFAEEGKFKKNVQFYDNSLRPQQLITNLNSENTVLVSETDYDIEGRSSVQILPAPVKEQAEVNYYFKPSFNMVRNNHDLLPFNFKHHDINNPLPLVKQRGAEWYFSDENDLEIINKDYIPFSEGFPYVQTKYKNDNTGKLTEQSGIGSEFKLNNSSDSKTTKYYYLTPSQTDLVRIFGSDIGDQTHYSKTLTRDPNGQISVNYTDMSGKTIATSFYGDKPANVEWINEDFPNGIDTEILQLPVNSVKTDNSTSSYYTFFNSIPGNEVDFLFLFNLVKAELEKFCVTCPYNVTFKLFDPDNLEVDITGLNIISNQIVDIKENQDCDFQSTVLKKELPVTLVKIGEYRLEKILTTSDFNLSELEQTVSVVVETELVEIEETINDLFDECGCILTCNEYCDCQGEHNIDFDVAACKELCETSANEDFNSTVEKFCDFQLDLLISQIKETTSREIVMPDLQNVSDCLNNADVNGISFNILDKDFISYTYLFNATGPQLSNLLTGEQLNSIVLNNALDEEFIFDIEETSHYEVFNFDNSFFQEEFYKAYLGCHREICHYQKCKSKSTSAGFDESLKAINNIEEAFTKFNIQSGDIRQKISDLLIEILETDPFNIGFCESPTFVMDRYNEFTFQFIESIIPEESIEDFCGQISDHFESLNICQNDCNSLPCILSYFITKIIPETTVDPSLEDERAWDLVSSVYYTFKQRISEDENCFNCEYLDPALDYVIYKKTINSDLNYNQLTGEMYQIFEEITSGSDDPESCSGRADVLEDFFREYFVINESTPLNNLSDRLSDHCMNECGIQINNTIYETNMEVNSFPRCTSNCNSICYTFAECNQWYTNGYMISDFIYDPVFNSFCPVPTEHFNAGKVQLVSTQSNDFEYIESHVEECMVGGFEGQKHLIISYAPKGRNNRIVVHTDKNVSDPITNLKIRILGQGCQEGSVLYYEPLLCNIAQNNNGDIIADFEISQTSSFPIITLHFYMSDPSDEDKPFTFEIFSGDQAIFTPSGYCDFYKIDENQTLENGIHLNSLKEVNDEVKIILGPENYTLGQTNVRKFLSNVWDCENVCANIDPCLENILVAITQFMNNGGLKSTAFMVSHEILTPNAGTIVFKHFKDRISGLYNWWFDLSRTCMSINRNEPLLLRFITKEGLVPNIQSFLDGNQNENQCTYLKIYDYKPTLTPYSFLAYNADTDYIYPDIKILLANEVTPIISGSGECGLNSTETEIYFQTAYMVIENKLTHNKYWVSDCNVTYEEVDCMNQVSETRNYILQLEKERRITSYIAEIQQVNCLENINEIFTKEWRDFMEHHFTLYYYDQVGNLVKTVPPAGVVLKDVDEQGELQLPTLPHEKESSYRYNSFNQIIWSNTPDAGET
jgi:hypothetical protein